MQTLTCEPNQAASMLASVGKPPGIGIRFCLSCTHANSNPLTYRAASCWRKLANRLA
jgi:hypothetical protein